MMMMAGLTVMPAFAYVNNHGLAPHQIIVGQPVLPYMNTSCYADYWPGSYHLGEGTLDSSAPQSHHQGRITNQDVVDNFVEEQQLEKGSSSNDSQQLSISHKSASKNNVDQFTFELPDLNLNPSPPPPPLL
ncbi:unnamed protein product [Amaranthus hypochondriacus]